MVDIRPEIHFELKLKQKRSVRLIRNGLHAILPYASICYLYRACGVLVYELIVGYPPFDGEDDDIVTVDIMHREVKEMPDCLSPECKNLVLGVSQHVSHLRTLFPGSVQPSLEHTVLTNRET